MTTEPTPGHPYRDADPRLMLEMIKTLPAVIRWGVGAGSPGSTGSFSSPYAGDFENETNNSHASAYVGGVDKPVEPGEPAAPPAQRSASVLEGKRGDGGALEADGHGQTSELPVVPACAGMSRERRFWRSPSQGGPRVRGDEPPIDERIRAAGMDGIEEVSKAVNAEVARQNSLPEGQSR